MRILCIGDVVGNSGCKFLRNALPTLKNKYKVDIVMVNGENSAQGNGILPSSATHLLDSGVDIITTGNHVFKRREIFDMLEENQPIIRPANYNSAAPGRGVYELDMMKYSITFINLMGTAMLEPLDNPFHAIDKILEGVESKIIVLDFHAEATAEKIAMGYHLDGRVSLVVGTHTHVQTADAQILPNKTGYITDLGMCGGVQSVLGVKPENAIHRFKTHLPTRFENVDSQQYLSGIIADIDEKTGECLYIEAIRLEETEEMMRRRG